MDQSTTKHIADCLENYMERLPVIHFSRAFLKPAITRLRELDEARAKVTQNNVLYDAIAEAVENPPEPNQKLKDLMGRAGFSSALTSAPVNVLTILDEHATAYRARAVDGRTDHYTRLGYNAAAEAIENIRKELTSPAEQLCEDEGCDHFGTPRVCISSSRAQDVEPLTENGLFAFLCRKYRQHAEARQREMGLQYTTAETHDLAKEIFRFVAARCAALEKGNQTA